MACQYFIFKKKTQQQELSSEIYLLGLFGGFQGIRVPPGAQPTAYLFEVMLVRLSNALPRLVLVELS
jgi:hypothetical protein